MDYKKLNDFSTNLIIFVVRIIVTDERYYWDIIWIRKLLVKVYVELRGEEPEERDKSKVKRSVVSAAIALLAWKSSYSSRGLETMRREQPVQCRLGRAGWVSATKITPAGEYYGTLQ